MKKERNCGMTPYPVYQQFPNVGPNMMIPGVMPPMMPPGSMPMNPQYTMNTQDNISSNTAEQQMTQMQRQINNLESRVNKLESSINTIGNSAFNSTQYSSGNYHIV